MVQHIGIVACSAEGAALCYRTICREGGSYLGEYGHPEITLHTFSLSEYTRHIESGNWREVADLMLSSVDKLTKVGAEFAICPDNTIHQAFDLVVSRSPIPWLHIAEEVVAEAVRQKFKCLGILGTRYLMEGSVYSAKLNAQNIDYQIPNKKDQKRINEIILKELVHGHFIDTSRAYFIRVINRLKNQGCDAIILGCTEIPLLITEKDSPLPVLDSTRILARAALKKAIEG